MEPNTSCKFTITLLCLLCLNQKLSAFQQQQQHQQPLKLKAIQTQLNRHEAKIFQPLTAQSYFVEDVATMPRRDVLSRRDALKRTILQSMGSSIAFSSVSNANAAAPSKKAGGLANVIRSVSRIMDELQRDLMQERWDLVEGYPNQLRSYVPVFTSYTDSAFPTDIPTDKGLRVALRYEVGRFFGSLERLRQASNRKSLNEAFLAYSDMALHFDRYLRVGGLYTFYDDTVSLETYFQGVPSSSLVFADPNKDPAFVRDLIVLIKGPDKGRTGIVIGIYPDEKKECVVKLDRFKGIREIRIVPQGWAAKRLGVQDPDDVFLIPRSPSPVLS